ncbi:MAG TPA: ATP-binding protein [Oligoflexus sp.]|uniref:ATP-binding protein n=1 Tax=Oligoflexus sp. TaxID=1971216 RepID=UPI002D49C91A|nr:ATP-binding protein [Oligoflexus sp.]HYX36331.1 ATP-binding protein [Oligoflexus sp.]
MHRIESFQFKVRFRVRFMIVALLLFAVEVYAGVDDSVDLNDFRALEIQMKDNPSWVIDWLKRNLTGIDRKHSPKAWVRAIFAYGQLNDDGFDELIPTQDVQKATALALKLKLYVEWSAIRAQTINGSEDSQDRKLAGLAKLIDELRIQGDEQALTYALAVYAAKMVVHRDLNHAMRLLHEAQDLLNRQPQSCVFVFDTVKSFMAMALLYQGQRDAAIGTYQSMEQLFRKLGIRAARARVLYSLGLAVFRKEEKQGSTSAEPYFRESLRLATEIGAKADIASSFYGLSLVKLLEKKPEEARLLAQNSLKLYSELEDSLWIAYLEKQLARVELDAGYYAKALVHAERAQSQEMLSDKTHQNSLEYVQYKAHLGLSDTKKALTFLKKYMESFEQIAAKKEKEEYNRAAVNLGLQYEVERNAALAKQNEMQFEQIHLLNKFRIVSIAAISLTLLVLCVLYVVQRQSRELRASREVIESSRQDMRSILDNIKIGVFSISDPLHFRVDPERSKSLQNVLGADPGEDYTIDSLLLDHSNLDRNRIDTIHSCLAGAIGENAVNFEMNSEQFPSELVVHVGGQRRIIDLDWSVTLKSDGETVQRVLVSCRDATDLRAYQEASMVQRRELGLIEELMQIPHERFLLFCASVRKAVEENRQILGTIAGMERSWLERALKMIFINLHTIKGGARTLGFKELALSIHQAEGVVIQIRAGSLPLDTESLLKDFSEIISRIDEYALIAKEKLNRNDAAVENVSLSRSYLKTLLDGLLTRELLTYQKLEPLMGAAYVPASRLVHEAEALLPRLARDLEKPLPQVHKIGFDGIFLDHECYTILTDSLKHLIRNSMDHGIESPEERSDRGKPESGTFTFEAGLTAEGDCILSLSDDGRGLALGKIRAIGVSKGILNAHQKYEPGDIAELIFKEGFSTASTVTEISGRGVGMGAVQEFIGRLGGSLQIEFMGDAGEEYARFKFSIRIPAEHIRQLTANEGSGSEINLHMAT